MPVTNRSLGRNLLGNVAFKDGGVVVRGQSATLSYTQAGAAVALFTLPANAIVDHLNVIQKTADNAGSSATISVGKTQGSPIEYLNAADAKAAQTAAYPALPAAYGSVGSSAITVYGLLTETGTASSAGSFYITCQYHLA